LLLPVSAPFHSSLLKPAAQRLAAYLVDVNVRVPSIDVVHNVDVQIASTADAVRAALAGQAASAVRWVETVQWFVAHGVTHIVECGPGTVLSGLCRRIAPDLTVMPLSDGAAIAAAIATVNGA
jgi:[acyl-carrier-protein] S-malonyltransferase